ncbi:1-(5-phosphoribosyl)-5-[(5-phosphoribosylamino)methylideneamino]imidazole-4-carboxamide isomerase [Oceanobacillus neutriphilus]|uniref:1-(5-phosphoribosyl)-5-[(5-phosphoribosylamino)methylideneamino] imidazole-4-carboxamide isomerase n=1 Tax=Oceanobacillus neutriphilus TaxID=531815 RepID=A0ABQ2P071_9BACI|nr:1-(5-phosphoribosyl)-5-[(5-phosphoribosylamino)methylideneamino]imidazole-4-carboxamide isomerase [Oceanobacillus neutriphilus]GGP14941.1 1-(5-phosphoribosyl)-5-[(5-phosphoribosylamino) methylideneamino] imidazole-4-carboxamide isomerase [Oceanobacillus neutriphilus]
MIIFPAIDVKDGNCVRLKQGDYNQQTTYNNSPVETAKKWQEAGGTFLHMVDLDGAKTGNAKNKAVILETIQALSIPVEVGGGIRSLDTIKEYVKGGAARVILGTSAITDWDLLTEAIRLYGDKIAVSLDARNGYVATDGWTKDSDTKAADLAKKLEAAGLKTIVYTDILKDGMLRGPNLEELKAMQKATNMNIIASGGVSRKEDVTNLQALGLYGAIIGKALYDGTIQLEDVVKEDNHAR